jgi:hypothetical protein
MIKPQAPPYKDTKSVEETQMDITRLLKKFGIEDCQWTTLWSQNAVELKFVVETEPGKHIIIKVKPPFFMAKRKTWDPKQGKHVITEAPNWAQSFRCLFYWLKAKLEAVAYGLREIEEEFLSDMVVKTPDGEERTVGELVRPAITDGCYRPLSLPSQGEPRPSNKGVVDGEFRRVD